jgi:hypothetical protein
MSSIASGSRTWHGWVRARFGVGAHAERTAVFGVSAGAGSRPCHWASPSRRLQRDLLPSPAGGYKPPRVMPSSLPRAYLVAGTQEPFFHHNGTRWATGLRDAGAEVVMTERVGSHGDPFWQEERTRPTETLRSRVADARVGNCIREDVRVAVRTALVIASRVRRGNRCSFRRPLGRLVGSGAIPARRPSGAARRPAIRSTA